MVGQDDDDDVTSGIVLMRKGENPSRGAHAVKAKMAQLNESVLPKHVQIVPFYDRTWLISKTLRTVFTNLLEGALLVTVVLILFLGNLRAALIVALVIPLSLLATFLGLTFVGIPANLLSLGAMDFGIIVDGAVIVVENVFRRAVGGRERARPRLQTILEATVEVGRPTLFSMLIIISAHIPIFTLQRHEGRIFAPMAWSVTSALVGSLILSLTLVPLLCLKLLPQEASPRGQRARALPEGRVRAGAAMGARAPQARDRHRRRRASLRASRWCRRSARSSCRSSTKARSGSTSVSAIGVGDRGEGMNRRIRKALGTIPEVSTVMSKAGRPKTAPTPRPISMAEVFCGLKPQEEWRKG